ncbi:hypothetical protein FQA39_LY17177 [Lamprigera yunnana]|nr:hypothetical protein FQA39_LY17177 [Lamprigera yunnana]
MQNNMTPQESETTSIASEGSVTVVKPNEFREFKTQKHKRKGTNIPNSQPNFQSISPDVPLSNRFQLLSKEGASMTATSDNNPNEQKIPRPPPIFIHYESETTSIASEGSVTVVKPNEFREFKTQKHKRKGTNIPNSQPNFQSISPDVPLSNRFQLLSKEGASMTATSDNNPNEQKTPRPPPKFIHYVNNTTPLWAILNSHMTKDEYQYQAMSGGTVKLLVKAVDKYKDI